MKIFTALSCPRLLELYDECYKRCPAPPWWAFWEQRRHKAKALAQCVQILKEWLRKANPQELLKQYRKDKHLKQANTFIKPTSNSELSTIYSAGNLIP